MTGHASARSRRAGKSASLLRRIHSPYLIQRYQYVRAATVAAFGAWNSFFQALRRSLRSYLHRGSPGFGACRSPLQPGEAPFPGPASQSETELVVGLHRAKQVNCCSRIHATTPPRRPWSTRTRRPIHAIRRWLRYTVRKASDPESEPATPEKRMAAKGPVQCKRRKGRGTHRQQAHSNRRGSLATP